MADIHVEFRIPENSPVGKRLQDESRDYGQTINNICRTTIFVTFGEKGPGYLGVIKTNVTDEIQQQINQLQQQIALLANGQSLAPGFQVPPQPPQVQSKQPELPQPEQLHRERKEIVETQKESVSEPIPPQSEAEIGQRTRNRALRGL